MIDWCEIAGEVQLGLRLRGRKAGLSGLPERIGDVCVLAAIGVMHWAMPLRGSAHWESRGCHPSGMVIASRQALFPRRVGPKEDHRA